jgi:hypothetical protein
MRYQNHIRGREMLDDKVKGNVTVITGANSSIRSATAPRFLSEGRLEKEGR